jgi:hypothetical protein
VTPVGLYLLALHFLGDWLLQSDTMAARKLDSVTVRLAHVTMYTLTVAPIVLVTDWSTYGSIGFLAIVFGTHFSIDSRRWKKPVEGFPTRAIWFDQAYHVISLGAAVAIIEVIGG